MPIYTALAGGSLGLLVTLLGVRVSLMRMAGKWKEPGFERAQRVHGNAVEHVPLMLVMLFIAESIAATKMFVMGLAIAAVVCRVMHAVGYSIRREHPLQFWGATLTYIVEGGLALLVLVTALK